VNKKEKLIMIDILSELKSFLYLSATISDLSRCLFEQPTRELVQEHRIVGRRLIELHKELTKLAIERK